MAVLAGERACGAVGRLPPGITTYLAPAAPLLNNAGSRTRPPTAPHCREYPAFVERYIAGTSDLFRRFIDQGLGELEAAEGGAGGARGAAQPPAQQAQQRPPLSPAGAGAGYGGAASPGAALPVPGFSASPAASPAGSASSAARLAALRERMGGLRVSTEGGGAGSGPPSGRASATAELGSMASSLEGLQARLANLQASRRGSNTPTS